MSNYAKFEFRCRRCGEVFSDIETSENMASQHLINAMLGVLVGNGIRLEMLSNHFDCIKKGEMGVGDLIGYRIIEST